MTEQELKELIAQHEADRIEFTISTKDTDKFSEAVRAFANDLPKHDRPGHLVIGVDDNGRYAGISISDQLLRNLGGLRDDGNIQPLPAISVEKIVTAQGEVAVITVQPALLPPVRYKGRVCIRNGPRRGYATEHEERILIERNVEAYPQVAVRELLMNAVMHRDYASTAPLRITWLNDRVEIQSPGGLYGEASRENFPRQTSYRNPVVAEAMKGLGYVNRYGRGVLRAQAALEKNGSPPPEFQFDAGYVLETLHRRA